MTYSSHRPPVDPEVGAVLEAMGEELPVTITRDMIPLLRQGTTADVTDETLAAEGLTRTDYTIKGYNGDSIELSVIARSDHSGLGPGIFHTHGGGMIAGTRMSAMGIFIPWIVEHDAVCVTVEYRLAPEFPDPFPVEDCYSALLWTVEHATEIGIDADRLMIGGASAGGGIAAGTALMARDREGPKLVAQMLICPMLDDRNETVSSHQYEGSGTWDRGSNIMGWTALLSDRRGTENVSIYAAPARATDLTNLPPAFIDCGSAEVFRDEDVAYATNLWAAGVQAELHVWPGGFHGFDLLAPEAVISKAAIAARNTWAARYLGKKQNERQL